ncbi:MAG: hypothetical protein M1134_05605 [Actinobacteria bacterium]|nr:hypothetical protein [Actinomycetota bacterium]MCL5445786.1 hypothetical protein [Actinomycetota bacterium]
MNDRPTVDTEPPSRDGPGREPTGDDRGWAGLGLADSQWPAKAADAVDVVVATVNDRAIRPIILAARAIVFGIIVVVLLVLVSVLFSIAVLRILDVYVFAQRVWASYLVLGALFTGGGLVAWSRRKAKTGSDR